MAGTLHNVTPQINAVGIGQFIAFLTKNDNKIKLKWLNKLKWGGVKPEFVRVHIWRFGKIVVPLYPKL